MFYVLCSRFLLQESPGSDGHSDLLQQVHCSEYGQSSCLGVKPAMTGSNCVLIDAPHWFSSACPVKESTVAAFALQPAEAYCHQLCFVEKNNRQTSLNYREASLRRRG